MAALFRLTVVLALVIGLSGCSRLLFHPTTPWYQNPARQGLDYQDVVLIHADGLRLHGWWLPAQGASRGSVYFLHGNGQNISTHLASVQWLPEQGFNVFLLDYRGYGFSEGKARYPEVLADTQLGLDWLVNQKSSYGPITVFGQSLGGALTARLMGDPENQGKAACVVMEASFASYRGITRDVMSQSWLLWPFRGITALGMPNASHDPEVWVGDISPTPLMIMHSEDDPIVPFAHGERLKSAANDPVRFLAVNGPHIAAMADGRVQQQMVSFMRDHQCRRVFQRRTSPESNQNGANGNGNGNNNGVVPVPQPPQDYSF